MAEMIAVKTKYQDELEKVHSRLMEGKRKVADVKDKNNLAGKGMVFAEMNIGRRKQMVRVIQIGANSFGLEVKISYKGDTEWTALEQFNKHQQQIIAGCIDWTTLK